MLHLPKKIENKYNNVAIINGFSREIDVAFERGLL